MKKTTLLYTAAVCIATAFAGCSKDNIEPGNQDNGTTSDTGNGGTVETVLPPHKTVTATALQTRTSLDGLDVLWSTGDAISLFNENGKTATYTLVGEGGQSSGDFEIATEPETGYRYAIYPAVTDGESTGASIGTSIPTAQTYNGDGFPAVYPMAAVSEDGQEFVFSNMATILDLSIVGDARVSSITLRTADGAKLAGDATVDYSGETPVLTATGSDAVTLTCTEPVQLSGTAVKFRFIVAPGTYRGFQITVKDENQKETVISTDGTASDFLAGSVKDFGGTMGVYASGFENIYILGDGTFYSAWDSGLMTSDPAYNAADPASSEWTSKFTKGENGVWTWTGVLAAGTIKFPWNADITKSFFGVDNGKLVYYPVEINGYDPKLNIGTPGKYSITIDINKLTFDLQTIEEYPVPENLYLFGDGTGAGWGIDHGEKMVKRPDLKFGSNADGDGVFYMVTRLGAINEDQGFKFLDTHTGEDFNAGYQFAWGLSKIWKGGSDRKYNAVKENGMYSIKVDTKYWNYEVVKMTGENPAEIYIYGNATDVDWDLSKVVADDSHKMASADGINYTWTGNLKEGDFKFAFGGMYLSEEGAPELSYDNGFLVTGNANDGWKVVVRTDIIDDTKYTVSEAGSYTVSINTDTMDLTVAKN